MDYPPCHRKIRISPGYSGSLPSTGWSYKSPETPNDRYENSFHTDATWREEPPFGSVLRCVVAEIRQLLLKHRVLLSCR